MQRHAPSDQAGVPPMRDDRQADVRAQASTAATSATSRGRTTAGVSPWNRPVQSTA